MKQDALGFLIKCCRKFQEESQQVMLETLWALSFNEKAAKQMRADPDFLATVEKIKSKPKRVQGLRRGSRVQIAIEGPDDGVEKAASGLLWKVVQGMM